MRLRDQYIMTRETVSDSETVLEDINIRKPITQLIITYEADNGATSNQGVRLHDNVDEIAIIDGGEVYHSLTGIQQRALNFREMGKMPPATFTEAAGGTQRETFVLNFGRYPGDPDFAFNPTRFANPQLRLVHSLTISATAGFATGTGVVTVIARVIDDQPAGNGGFFGAKEHYSFTSAASGDERVKIPSTFPIRLLMFRGYESGIALNTDITNAKLTLNQDELVLFDKAIDEWMDFDEALFGREQVLLNLLRTDADAITTWSPVIDCPVVNAVNDLDVASIDAITVNQITLQLLSLTTLPAISKSTTDTEVRASFLSPHPFFTLVYPLFDIEKRESFYKPPSYGTLELVLTQGAAGAAVEVVTQHLR